MLSNLPGWQSQGVEHHYPFCNNWIILSLRWAWQQFQFLNGLICLFLLLPLSTRSKVAGPYPDVTTLETECISDFFINFNLRKSLISFNTTVFFQEKFNKSYHSMSRVGKLWPMDQILPLFGFLRKGFCFVLFWFATQLHSFTTT